MNMAATRAGQHSSGVGPLGLCNNIDNQQHLTHQGRGEGNKAGYTATLVACGWAGAVLEKVTRAFGQELYSQKAQKRRKSKKGTDKTTVQPTNGPT